VSGLYVGAVALGPGDGSEVRVYRYRSMAERWFMGFGLALYAWILGDAIVNSPPVIWIPLAAFLAGIAFRYLRGAVLVSSDGVTVRNLFWTYRFPWVDVERFSAGPRRDSGRSFRHQGVLELVDGSTVVMHAVAAANISRRPAVADFEDMIATLNEELERATTRPQ
jgi:PH (Pleckstrin Homology) domain-containing protein